LCGFPANPHKHLPIKVWTISGYRRCLGQRLFDLLGTTNGMDTIAEEIADLDPDHCSYRAMRSATRVAEKPASMQTDAFRATSHSGCCPPATGRMPPAGCKAVVSRWSWAGYFCPPADIYALTSYQRII
jgi:hypothetical protein